MKPWVVTTMLLFNFTNFSEGVLEWFMTPFGTYIGNLKWVLIFAMAIFITLLLTKSLLSTIAIIMLTFALFGTTEAFLQYPQVSVFFAVVTITGIAGLFTVLYLKRKFE
jgi:hypothetical protein